MIELAAVTIMKNESTHIAEWVAFHITQGFQKFYIYDNHSTDFPAHFLAPYIEAGIVEMREIPEHMHNQYAGYWIYGDLFPYVEDKVKWLWCGSTDEFMFTPDYVKNGVRVLLNEYDRDNVAALQIPWTNFNSIGKIKRERGLIIERFHHTFQEKICHVKSIVRPNRVIKMIDPHSSAPKEGFICIDENNNSVYGPFAQSPSSLRIRINHYVSMSAHEYRVKISKGRADVPGHEVVARPSQWTEYHPPETKIDETITPLIPAMRDELCLRFFDRPELISWLL